MKSPNRVRPFIIPIADKSPIWRKSLQEPMTNLATPMNKSPMDDIKKVKQIKPFSSTTHSTSKTTPSSRKSMVPASLDLNKKVSMNPGRQMSFGLINAPSLK